MSDLIKRYKNGNYYIEIYNDGTKYRLAKDNNLKPKFPESIDLKITNYCDLGCPMCHENSTIEGKHANLKHPFFKTLKAGTELAIGGGNPLSHPELEEFLKRMNKQGILCNMTVNQRHFMLEYPRLKRLVDSGLITALGVSLADSKDEEFIKLFKTINNAVMHVIIGLFNNDDYENLKDKGLKLLMLGYKQYGRGKVYYSDDIKKNINWLYMSIQEISKHFKITSFDNLGIVQANMRRFFTTKDWNTYYMGDDGGFTMYIDVVKESFAASSISDKRYKLKRTINGMFKTVLTEAAEW